MKEAIRITSVLCGIMAVISVVTGIRVLTGHGYFVGLAIFSMARSGTVMGFFGNIIGMALTALGFGAMAVFGFSLGKGAAFRKKAFVWGLVMSALCVISVICSIFAHSFNFGDIILLALPLVYTYAVLKSA